MLSAPVPVRHVALWGLGAVGTMLAARILPRLGRGESFRAIAGADRIARYRRTPPTFNGPIRLADVVTEDNAAGAPAIHNVVFAPGVINAWHEHEAGQILIVTDGVGYHQIAGQPVEILRPGDVAVCPPGVRHWHGAAPNSRFSHLAANGRRGRVGVTWHEMLTSEEYQALPRP